MVYNLFGFVEVQVCHYFTEESYSIYEFSLDRFEICYKLSGKQKTDQSKHSSESGLQTSIWMQLSLWILQSYMSIKSS